MRNQILEFLKSELVGPNPIDPFIQENGEEILVYESPRIRYSTGVLFPQGSITDSVEGPTLQDNDIEADNNSPIEEEKSLDTDDNHSAKTSGEDSNDSNDEFLNLTNAFLPSALGMSACINIPDKGLLVKIFAGRYVKKGFRIKDQDRQSYYRESLDCEIKLNKSEIPSQKSEILIKKIKKDNENTGLELNIVNRGNSKEDKNNYLLTFSLINSLNSASNFSDSENCFFQVSFSIESQDESLCFNNYPNYDYLSEDDAKSNSLLYKHRKTFAVGHGCSPAWDIEAEEKTSKISAEIIPSFEIKPILPYRIPDLQLSMVDFCNPDKTELTVSNLNKLISAYKVWIENQEKTANEFDSVLEKETALKHLEDCHKCLDRISDGVNILKTDKKVLKAFQLMNRAMVLQQLHYNLPLRNWDFTATPKKLDEIVMPEINDISTWPKQNLGNWFPFQIAFILMNLKSMSEPDCTERDIVDLIWFPTGGGKTEAYLGLSAFTILLRRLKDKNSDGTTVIMRYTLRLLTAQQFERAASMICACELIRKENESELGGSRISIGLWVGDALSPNTRVSAVSVFKELSLGRSENNKFMISKCPWCGAKMGPIKNGNNTRIIGYKQIHTPSTIIFICENNKCEFSERDFNLPLIIIDEDIYENPPSLLVGTVDKFAIMIWKPEGIRRLFGFRDGKRISPPELIIQDELHLISGPLGSMVGHYETLIDELCKNESVDKIINAKIVASTATVSRAKEQINSLYNRGIENVLVFPTQAIRAGESFFAYEDKVATGRLYVGIHAAGLSHATAHVRVISALLQSVLSIKTENESDRNCYWTILDYYNSLRELGHAATRLHADIPEYMGNMFKRLGLFEENRRKERRFINKYRELTSRIESSKIPQSLKELEIPYPKEKDQPVDICLATNMISVGVDIPRLGLMTVTGQPKTASEYIQATSRVGRSLEGPGLVVVIYNVQKPRDRSHYERFLTYHSKIYSFVEPTSVTPFSAPVDERALHALLIGLVRYLGTKSNQDSPQNIPDEKLLNRISKIILDRVRRVDPEEVEYTEKLLNKRIAQWKRLAPATYGNMFSPWSEPALMYPSSMEPPDEDIRSRTWSTATSMRNVDRNCEAAVISDYLEGD